MKTILAVLGATACLAATVPAQAQALLPATEFAPESLDGFRAEALRSDAYEIESSRLALQRSRDPKVRSYARRMINDHKQTTDALLPEGTSLNATGNVVQDGSDKPFSSPLGILTYPLTAPVNFAGRFLGGESVIDNEPAAPGRRVALDGRRQQQLNALASTGGRSFNATYAAQQVASHREAVALYGNYATSGADETGRTFAGQVLPHLQGHLVRSERLASEYNEAF